jgi:hypothetical protein
LDIRAFRDAGDELQHILEDIQTGEFDVMTQYHIPCNHQHTGDVADHYPLTTQEVIDLLETARATKDHIYFNPMEGTRTIASIQVRLAQGIPGLTCPRQIDGPVAEKMNALDHAYVEWIQHPDTLFFKEVSLTETTDIVVTLTNLMK